MSKIIGTTKTLTKFVLASIIIILVYTIFELYSSIVFGVQHDTLTTCIFGFFGTEIAACGFIKIFKLKEGMFYDK